jgi:hypothetical protein
MYERVVTTFYIANNPSQAKRFWNYFSIHKYKMMVHAKRVMPNPDKVFPKPEIETITAERNAVKDDYMDACEVCGARRPLPSWIKGGMDTMCKTTKELQQRYFHCYYWPTLHDHATPNNIIERLELAPDDQLRWNEDAQRDWADIAVSNAHWMVVEILDLNNKRFKLGLEDRIRALEDGWRKAWIRTPLTSAE